MANTVRFEELVIAGILQFGEVDQLDIELLKEWLKSNYDLEIINGRIICNCDYINSVSVEEGISPWLAEKYFLNPLYSFESNVSQENGKFSLRKRLEFSQCATLSKAFEDFDQTLFILRKIRKLSSLPYESFLGHFNRRQQKILKKLKNKNYVNDLDNQITTLGEARLFIYDHLADVNNFLKLLNSACSLNFLELFISTMNLNGCVGDILNIQSFNDFCATYDIFPESSDDKKETNSYIKLESNWKRSGNSLIHKLLEIKNSDVIYACHPNCLFQKKLELDKNDVPNCWEDINIEQMKKLYDFRKFNFCDYYKSISWVNSVLNGQSQFLNDKPRYLALTERYCENGTNNYVVKGILKSVKGETYVLLNPGLKRSFVPDENPDAPLIKEYKP